MDKKPSQRKKISSSATAAIGALITLVGGFLLFYNYISSKKIMAYDYMSSVFYNSNELQNITEDDEKNKPLSSTNLQGEVTDDYIGYLTIPKINLTKGFLDKRSLTKGFLDYRYSENDVEKNILVVDGSNYPNVEKGNFILAGHSGTGWKAFFNDLYKLKINDVIYINYKNKKCTYTITSIYTQPKIGKIAIYRDYNKTTLTLITCTNNDSKTQTIYIAELVNVE